MMNVFDANSQIFLKTVLDKNDLDGYGYADLSQGYVKDHRTKSGLMRSLEKRSLICLWAQVMDENILHIIRIFSKYYSNYSHSVLT